MLNTTFNNISVISWRSVLLVEETGVPGENHRPAVSHQQTCSHIVVQILQSGNFWHQRTVRIYGNLLK
jgi:hypothetical protein